MCDDEGGVVEGGEAVVDEAEVSDAADEFTEGLDHGDGVRGWCIGRAGAVREEGGVVSGGDVDEGAREDGGWCGSVGGGASVDVGA